MEKVILSRIAISVIIVTEEQGTSRIMNFRKNGVIILYHLQMG
jgi:hypothetical protein